MSSVPNMKATQINSRVDASAATQNFAAGRCTGEPGSCPGGNAITAASNASPYFPNGTVRCASCANSTRIGVVNFLRLETLTRPGDQQGKHVQFGNY